MQCSKRSCRPAEAHFHWTTGSMRGVLPKGKSSHDPHIDYSHCRLSCICVLNPISTIVPRFLRTYKTRSNFGPRATIRQALHATLADQIHLSSVQIPAGSEEFISGVLGFNNPSGLVSSEIPKALPKAPEVACIVNLGSGHAELAGVSPTGHTKEELHEIVMDCERSAEVLTSQAQDVPGLFIRLSVTQGMQQYTCPTPQSPATAQSTLLSLTKGYLQTSSVNSKIDALVQVIAERRSTISTARLGECLCACCYHLTYVFPQVSFAGPDPSDRIETKLETVQDSLCTLSICRWCLENKLTPPFSKSTVLKH